MNKPQHWAFLLIMALILVLLPGTALAEPEGRVPHFPMKVRDTPAATGDSLILIVESEHGRVEADKETAVEGETVTLTVTPDAGYILDVLTVLQGDEPVTVNDYIFAMPAGDVTVTAAFRENPWQKLKSYMGNMGESIKIQLVKPGEETREGYKSIYTDANGCITAESGCLVMMPDVVLDLNGCTIYGQGTYTLFSFGDFGQRFTVEDSAGGGRILANGIAVCVDRSSYTQIILTGGCITGYDIGIILRSTNTFTMTGGSITGCGNGVELHGSASFTMIGGSVTGCRDGVHVWDEDGVFTVSGSPVIQNNAQNLYLRTKTPISVAGPLEEGARIGITMNEPGVFARGENYTLTPEDAACFFSDDPAYTVRLNAENNELVLYEPSTGYPPNNGGGNQTEAADDDGDNVLKHPAGLLEEPQFGSAPADTDGETGFSFAEILRLLLLQMLGFAWD